MRSLRPFVGAALAAATLFIGLAASPVAARDAWLGISLQDLDAEMREALDLADELGVLVAEVHPDSPAEEAGLQDGDVILEIDGRRITGPDRLVKLVRRADPGDEIEITLVRDGDQKEIVAVLAEQEDPQVLFFGDGEVHRLPRIGRHPGILELRDMPGVVRLEHLFSRPRLGVETRKISDDLAPYFEVEPGEGVLVLDVMEDTPAENAELKEGDIILRFDGEPVRSPGDLRDMLLEYEGEEVTLNVRRHGDDREVTVTLDSPEYEWHDNVRSHFRLRQDQKDELRGELERLEMELEHLRDELRHLRDDRD